MLRRLLTVLSALALTMALAVPAEGSLIYYTTL